MKLAQHLIELGCTPDQVKRHVKAIPEPERKQEQQIDKRTGKPLEITQLRSFKRH